MKNAELIKALKEDAEWAHANEWETPITLGDHLDAAADALKAADNAQRWIPVSERLPDYVGSYLVYLPYCLGPAALLDGVKEIVPAPLSEVDRLNTVTAEYTSNSAEITINGRQYVPKDAVQALTARAEAAEAERDAAIADLDHLTYEGAKCEICKHYLDEDCITCEFEWRGQEAGKGEAE